MFNPIRLVRDIDTMLSNNHETERLILRPWRDSDKPAFAKMNANAQVMEFFPEIYTQEKSDLIVDKCNQRLARDGFTFWAVERKDQNVFIGSAGLTTFEAELPFCPCVEIGWRLDHEHWGQGFATEAARFCLSLGFNQFSLEEIFSFTTLANMRSRRVMEKIGMVDTKNNFLHPLVDPKSGMQEHCLYHAVKEVNASSQ